MIDGLRPVFADLAPSAMRMELTRLVDRSSSCQESLAETLLAQARGGAGGRPGGGAPVSSGARGRERESPMRVTARVLARASKAARRARRALSPPRGDRTTFLALCIASPEDGAGALEALDPDEHFTSERLRRAAVHLRAGRLVEPMVAIDEQDPELRQILAELVVQAGREFPGAGDARRAAHAARARAAGSPHSRRQRRRGQRRGRQRARAPPRRGWKRAFEQAYDARWRKPGRGPAKTFRAGRYTGCEAS